MLYLIAMISADFLLSLITILDHNNRRVWQASYMHVFPGYCKPTTLGLRRESTLFASVVATTLICNQPYCPGFQPA